MWLSIDWGNSSFRLHLVEEGNPPRIHWTHWSDHGALDAWKTWKRDPWGWPQAEAMRAALADLVGEALALHHLPPNGLCAVVSGMASSSIGIESLPYARCPFSLDGRALVHRHYEPDERLPLPLCVISGLCDDHTSMRGEETVLVGLHALDAARFRVPLTVVMPGTHSLHVAVKNETAVGAATFMTGEMFKLMRRESILAQSAHGDPLAAADAESPDFQAGVRAALTDGPLRSLFRVRARDLLEQRDTHANTCFLSGVLLGAEASDLAQRGVERVLLVGESTICAFYENALRIARIPVIDLVLEDEMVMALVMGQQNVRLPRGSWKADRP